MIAQPTTTVTILRASGIDSYTGDRTDEHVVATGLPASLIEEPARGVGFIGIRSSFRVEDPATDNPRVVRVASCRLPAGTDVTRTDRIRDERNGRTYAVRSVRQHTTVNPAADVLLELVRNDAEDP